MLSLQLGEGFVVVVALPLPLLPSLSRPSRTHDDELSAELWFMAFPMFFLHFLLVAKLIYIYMERIF